MEEWLLLDGVTLGSSGVSPGDVERAAAVVADFADAGLAFGDGAAVSAGEATDAVVLEFFVETGIGFADSLVENGTEGGHGDLLAILTLGRLECVHQFIQTTYDERRELRKARKTKRVQEVGILRLRCRSLIANDNSAQDDKVY